LQKIVFAQQFANFHLIENQTKTANQEPSIGSIVGRGY